MSNRNSFGGGIIEGSSPFRHPFQPEVGPVDSSLFEHERPADVPYEPMPGRITRETLDALGDALWRSLPEVTPIYPDSVSGPEL
jgi:hypothetical protein